MDGALSVAGQITAQTNVKFSDNTVQNTAFTSTLKNTYDAAATSVTQHGNDISALQTTVGGHTTLLQSHTNSLTFHNSDINYLSTNKQNLITTENKLSSDLVLCSDASSLTTKITTLESTIGSVPTHNIVTAVNEAIEERLDEKLLAIDTIIDTKQTILNGTDNQLPIAFVDISGSALDYVDVSSSITDKFTTIEGDIDALETLTTSHATTLSTHASSLASHSDTITNHGSSITSWVFVYFLLEF